MAAVSTQEVLGFLDKTIKREFDATRRILSYDEYLQVVAENPDRHLRGSARYALDMMDHFGTDVSSTRDASDPNSEARRFKVFDLPIEGKTPKVVGQELVQNQIYRALHTFVRTGLNNKLILLHGPNGSAKTSIVHALMNGMEQYSHAPEGALYRMTWIFPHERTTKSSMGIQSSAHSRGGPLTTYAHLPDDDVSARMTCELKDHPLLVIPVELRQTFLEKLVGAEKAQRLWKTLPTYLTRGDLSHRSRLIFDALLTAHQGDLRKVLMHIQVERFYLSRRYRSGLVTIEPQMHVDASYQQLTMNRGVSSLPSSLQGLNLFQFNGDLIDGNRGIVEFSDLLKRPVDSFKYLLTACETGQVNVGNSIAALDTVMIGSTNEIQLDAFKEFPDFTSFKARIELVRVPYLLNLHQEREIYESQLTQVAGDKPVAPHVAHVASLWAILTRLKKPNSINYPPNVSSLVSNLTPLEKARLYDSGEMPHALTPEDRKILRANLRRLRDEYLSIPYYEGRIGASAREIKAILYDAAQNPEFSSLSPLSVIAALEEFVKRVSEYDFLKQDVKDSFHDCVEFVQTVRNEYLQIVDREVRDSIGLYDSKQWEEFLRKYVQNLSTLLKKEKVRNPITGATEELDKTLIEELESIVEAPTGEAEREAFRQNILSQVGAWALDHPREPVVYAKVFPEYWRKLEKHYFETQKALLNKMQSALIVYSADPAAAKEAKDEGTELARKTIAAMVGHLGYTEASAREVIGFLMKHRY